MAYCEAAQKECRYLDQLELIKENTVLMRATSDGAKAKSASDVEKGLDGATDEFIANCSDDYCGLVGLAVGRAMVKQAEAIGRRI